MRPGLAIEGDRAVIIVTHDSRIFEFADVTAKMDDGWIVSVQRREMEEQNRLEQEVFSE
jgi:putative ABC transport system ATP-binding protein